MGPDTRVPLTVTNASLFTPENMQFYPLSRVAEPQMRAGGGSACSSQCTTANKWILLSLLYNWTGTCNVSQSFNSNLPWPVVGYIIINHPCQLAHTNCWIEAINMWTAFYFFFLFFCSLYILARFICNRARAGNIVPLLFLHGGSWLDASRWHGLCNLGWRRARR